MQRAFCAYRRKRYGGGPFACRQSAINIGPSWPDVDLFVSRDRGRRPIIAIYHLSIKIISRGKGKSAVAAAAYRAGEKITNQYDGLTHDYTRKGGVVHTEILLPGNAPLEYADRATLWNAVEQAEKNSNAQLAREIELALPVELSREQRVSLVRDYCRRHFASAGMCADICIHNKKDGNPHAHVMLTMRPFEQDGRWAAKSKKEYILDDTSQRIRLKSGAFKTRKLDATDWNEQSKAELWRQGWAELCNAALDRAGMAERIDHRSYARQGVEQIPSVHLGVAAFQMERRGRQTRRGDMNRQVELDNKLLRQLRARIRKLQAGLDEILAGAAPSHPIPSLADVLTGILENPEEKTRRQKIKDLKTFAKAVAFVQQHGISDLPGLRNTVAGMYQQLDGLSCGLKMLDRRLKTLDEHFRQTGNYSKYSGLHRQHQQLPPRKQAAFYERHRAELTLYEAAEAYLRGVLNGRTTIPDKAWRDEAKQLTAERRSLYADYVRLKEETHSAEAIRYLVEHVMREEPKRSARQERDMG